MRHLIRSDSIEKLNLSNRSYNVLQRANIDTVGKLIDFPQENFLSLKNLGAKSAAEILAAINNIDMIQIDDVEACQGQCDSEVKKEFMGPDGKMYFDISIENLGLSRRPYNCLKNAGISFFSQLQSMNESDFQKLPSMGQKSVLEILDLLNHTLLEPANSQIAQSVGTSNDGSSIAQRVVQALAKRTTINAGSLYEEICPIVNQSTIASQEPLVIPFDIQNELFDLPTLKKALESSILHRIECSIYGVNYEDIREIVPYFFDSSLLKNMLTNLEQSGEIFCRENAYERCYPSVLQYAETIPNEQNRGVFLGRLSGETLDEVGKKYGITRERARQIVVKWIKKAPKLSEDRYAEIYQKYYFEKSDLLKEFKISETTYNYLLNAYKHGECPISDLITDAGVPEEYRKAAERILYKNYVVLGGERVLCQRPELSEYVLRTAGTDGISFDEFGQLYQMLLEDIGEQDNPKLSLMGRGYENKLSASNHVLWKYGQKLRYYNIDSYDFSLLFDTLDLNQYHNVELSTLKFFKEYPDLMRDYDILDEYELHNLLKKICSHDAFPNMNIRRMPNIEFGIADRDSQVRELLLSLAPVENTALAEAYENEYGVLARTVLGGYLKNFDQYYHDGVYKVDIPALPEIIAVRLRQLLTLDYYPLADIRKIYKQEFPDAEPSLLNPFTVKSIGFRIYANYAISDRYASAAEYFRTIMTTDDLVDAHAFSKELLSTISYTSETYKLKSAYEIIEYAPLKYVNIRRLNRAGVNKDLLTDYCRQAYRVAGTKYFTLFSLRKAGFQHSLDELGFEEWFYGSILVEDKKHFSYRRMGGNRLFRCGDAEVSLKDFIEWLLYSRENLSLDINDLVALLKEDYNILIDQYKIAETVKGTAMYYDSITEKVYADYDVYFEEI